MPPALSFALPRSAVWGMNSAKAQLPAGFPTTRTIPRPSAGGSIRASAAARGAEAVGRGGGPGRSGAGRGRGRGNGGRAGGKPRPAGGKEGSSSGGTSGRFRVTDVKIPWREDSGKDSYDVTSALVEAVAKRMGLVEPSALPESGVQVVRKSFDARKVEAKAWVYVADVDAKLAQAANGGRRPRTKPGRVEWVRTEDAEAVSQQSTAGPVEPKQTAGGGRKRVVVVGSGPAGLFACVGLAEAGHDVLLLERGKAVEERGRDIGALFVRGKLNGESNLCYGEGGAGTWSDGKLTTRIGRNSDPVRQVLNHLYSFGAPESVLKSGKPHLGTDRLIRILQGCRKYLQDNGVNIRFGTRVEEVVISGGAVTGIRVQGQDELIPADHVVLAVGHSARALYEHLASSGARLEAKSFAMGFRIEHPQHVIDEIQYGEADAAEVRRGDGPIPVADYKLAATVDVDPGQVAELRGGWDASGESWRQGEGAAAGLGSSRGVYSFCMCPGGQIVPTSTDPSHLCINGMSFSRRNSRWANSALVVGVVPEDWQPWSEEWGPLAGMKLQEAIETRAAEMGGGSLVAPVQRAVDFLEGRVSADSELPSSSYRLGVKSSPCHLLYPPNITAALRAALVDFERRMPGFLHPAALLHGAETRTSAPVCIRRGENLQSDEVQGLWPAGEGAGYAGGIVSAAVDGLRVGRALAAELSGASESKTTVPANFKSSSNFY